MSDKPLHSALNLLFASESIKSVAKSTSRSIAHLAIGTTLTLTAALPNLAAAAVNPTTTGDGVGVESTLLARSTRRPFQGAPAPAWRRRCEIQRVVVGYRNVQALTNRKPYRVPTQSGWAIVRPSGQTTQRVPIIRPMRVCRTV
jgi:hypothetical protein